MKMQTILREENEQLMIVKSMNQNKLPLGLLMEGKEAILSFINAQKADSINEMRPNN